ncbi:hypothetical protein LX87_03351 [Larkinella arboricola]|uniref:Uncharacterized protein n=1 Tax=Larkinella arboricola TaxID=643671 RepID=A0A327WTF7_LARAB|nr:hypothetical protein [Larkinella arboricola]RAJ95604.1 hypothetical protein LX87_03351 [Larkinella arboricola]
MYSPSLMQYGQPKPLPKPRTLRAGPLTMLYERGFLRYIRLGNHEVLRLIYHAVRDPNWATASHVIEDEVIEQQDDSFHIRYSCVCRNETIHLRWQCEITGDPDGTIQFNIDGEALTTFQRNRAGFCILHPIPECAGQPCTLTHPDGSQTVASFPEAISPHQPFFNIREMQWATVNGGSAVLWFVGDVFETEDQRNWTDASYKTYCTPLAKPFPVTLKPGDKIQQSVELRLVAPDSMPDKTESETVVSLGSSTRPLPAIGIGANYETLTDSAVRWLREANFHHLRVEVNFQQPDWPDAFRKAVDDAVLLNVKLELVLIFNQLANYELYTFLKHTVDPVLIDSVLIVSNVTKTTPPSLINEVVPPLRQAFPTARIGAGTNAFFVAVNRETPPLDAVDFIAYSISPQAHATDNLTLIENTTDQADTVRDARRWIPDVHVSPVTLRPRFNPDATGNDPESAPAQMPFSTDPRQMSLIGAAWTLASLKNLMQAEARSLTYYEMVGEQGVVQGDFPSAYPDQFFAEAGMVFPLYWVFRAVNRFQGGHIIPTTSSQPLKAEALCLQNESQTVLILANQTDEPQTVRVPLTQPAVVRVLDETSFAKATLSPAIFWEESAQEMAPADEATVPFELAPYATVFIEW